MIFGELEEPDPPGDFGEVPSTSGEPGFFFEPGVLAGEGAAGEFEGEGDSTVTVGMLESFGVAGARAAITDRMNSIAAVSAFAGIPLTGVLAGAAFAGTEMF